MLKKYTHLILLASFLTLLYSCASDTETVEDEVKEIHPIVGTWTFAAKSFPEESKPRTVSPGKEYKYSFLEDSTYIKSRNVQGVYKDFTGKYEIDTIEGALWVKLIAKTPKETKIYDKEVISLNDTSMIWRYLGEEYYYNRAINQ